MFVRKTNATVISKWPGDKNDIKVDGSGLVQVDIFKYLGTQVTGIGRKVPAIKIQNMNRANKD